MDGAHVGGSGGGTPGYGAVVGKLGATSAGSTPWRLPPGGVGSGDGWLM